MRVTELTECEVEIIKAMLYRVKETLGVYILDFSEIEAKTYDELQSFASRFNPIFKTPDTRGLR